jgi:amino-acid N-acetyltransferase
MTIRIDEATRADLPSIRTLLDEAKLPHADLTDDTAVRFWIARGDALIGAIGLETFGACGLLRSLVVASAARGSGLGARLVRTVENAAVAAGICELVLLTQTAEPFFRKRGYAAIDRASAPAELRASTEFQSLCPASATCMSKRLLDGDERGP